MSPCRSGAALLLLTTLAMAADPPAGKPPAADEELHVVAVYEGNTRTGDMIHGGKAAVRVDRPGKDVTLVVSAYEPVTWEVAATARTKLTKVIVGGYHRQAARVPAGVEVVEAFREGRDRKESVFAYYNLDSARLRPAIQAIHKLTGQEVASYQGVYRFDPANPLVVDAVQKDPRLASDFPKVTPAADVPAVKVPAVRLTPAGRFNVVVAWGTFTQAGPDRNSFQPLPRGISRLAYDPAEKAYYGLTNHEVHEVDLAKGTSTKLDPGLNVPRLSWPCGIAFDTKRERLVVATLGGVGHLYTYSPKTGAWAVPAALDNVDLAALAYHPKDDTLYGLAEERGNDGGTPTLYRYNAQGALVGVGRLGAPMFPGLLGRAPSETRVQMVSAGDQLAVVVARGGRDENGKPGKAESFLFLIDPKTGKVKLAWKE